MKQEQSAEVMASLRVRYRAPELLEESLASTPLGQFEVWLAEAVAAKVPEPNAIALATSGPDGPGVRSVLAKSVGPQGLDIFTNLGSAKAIQIAHDQRVAAMFVWLPQHRQVIVRGVASRLADEEVAAYFATRPRDAQIGAWASDQSAVLSSRDELHERQAEVLDRFGDSDTPVPVPALWGGYRIIPISVEFWQGQPSRLHDRLRFRAQDATSPPSLDEPKGWVLERLSP